MQSLSRVDRALLRGVQALAGRHHALDLATIFAARWGSYLQILVWLSLLGDWRHAGFVRGWLRTGLALGLVTLPVFALRALLPRQRPFEVADAVPLVAREPGPSFPSRHTASAVAMALAVRPTSPGRGAVMVLLAIWMGLARIQCGLHYPSDVLGGALLGWLAARVARAVL